MYTCPSGGPRVNCGRIMMMATSLLLASATLGSWLVGHTWPLAGLMCPAGYEGQLCVPPGNPVSSSYNYPGVPSEYLCLRCLHLNGSDQVSKLWHSVILKLPLISRLSCCDSGPPLDHGVLQCQNLTNNLEGMRQVYRRKG